MNLKYFGTDGIRGKFGHKPITEVFMVKFADALAMYLENRNPTCDHSIVIGRDTRESGILLEKVLTQKLSERGIQVILIGIAPTATVSIGVKALKASLGIMITASHNSSEYNGLKVLDHNGFKLTQAEEALLEANLQTPFFASKFITVKSPVIQQGTQLYTDYIKKCTTLSSLSGWSIVLDTANGATYETSLTILEALGAKVHVIGNQPNGTNINQEIGSEHPERLVEAVKRIGARLGIAHDGDGDRLVICDEAGNLVAGETLLGILALHAFQQKQLDQQTVVTTVQSNTGLDYTLAKIGIQVVRADVGDRNVLQKMLALNCNIGGESSGHIIFNKYLPLGDGLLAALKAIEIMLHTNKPLSELQADFLLFPQLTANIEVIAKKPIETLEHLPIVINEIKQHLQGDGQVLVRYSGTEPKIRLLVEGPDRDFLKSSLERLKQAVIQDLCI
jgi:phosphoglucosamine mutase